LGRERGNKTTGFLPVGKHNSSKGNGALIPILSSVSWLLLAPGDECVHMASWDTP
jgi:hypothetical protein